MYTALNPCELKKASSFIVITYGWDKEDGLLDSGTELFGLNRLEFTDNSTFVERKPQRSLANPDSWESVPYEVWVLVFDRLLEYHFDEIK